ncbi:MAG: hypothetical protein N2588_09255 [Rhodovarius sp.]|nr:hypothetical protein [Rhodovarius sp.]
MAARCGWRDGLRIRAAALRLGAGMVWLLLAGCGPSLPGSALLSALSSPAVPPPAGSPQAVPAEPTDPVAVFAMSTPAGSSGTVTLPNGATEPARVLRAYHAASGRECREVLLGSGASERTLLYCRDPVEGVRLVPPLLRGGRP